MRMIHLLLLLVASRPSVPPSTPSRPRAISPSATSGSPPARRSPNSGSITARSGRLDRTGTGSSATRSSILHGTTGSGANFLRPEFAGELFGKGQPLDATRYYLILPDGIGHGGSSKPSDGLHARFPRYGYRDMIEAQHRLLTEGLKVDHLRLVMGTSMGGMHTWLWGETTRSSWTPCCRWRRCRPRSRGGTGSGGG